MYKIKLEVGVKTFCPLSEEQIVDFITYSLWSADEFRDIQIQSIEIEEEESTLELSENSLEWLE